MGRIRSVRPELWQDEDFASLDMLSRLVLLALLSVVDDEGRTQGRCVILTNQCFPWGEVASEDLRESVLNLADAGFLTLYVSGSKPVIEINGWKDLSHPMAQVVPKPRKSRFQPPKSPYYRNGKGTLPDEYETATERLPGDRTGPEGRTDRTDLTGPDRTDVPPVVQNGLRSVSGSGSAGGRSSAYAPPSGARPEKKRIPLSQPAQAYIDDAARASIRGHTAREADSRLSLVRMGYQRFQVAEEVERAIERINRERENRTEPNGTEL